MKKFVKPIFAVVLFAIMQALIGLVGVVIYLFASPEIREAIMNGGDIEKLLQDTPVWIMAAVSVVSGLLTVAIISKMKMINWRTTFCWKKDAPGGFWMPLIAAVAGFFAIDVLVEMLQLEDNLTDEFTALLTSWLGIIDISIIGPVIEELCFREGVMGTMVRKGVKPWLAILVSALLFGLIHANPVQIAGAGLMGIILGIIYYKTGNIVLTSTLHILNNSTSTVLASFYGMDATMSDLIGGTTPMVISAIIAAVFSIAMLTKYCKLPSNVVFEDIKKAPGIEEQTAVLEEETAATAEETAVPEEETAVPEEEEAAVPTEETTAPAEEKAAE